MQQLTFLEESKEEQLLRELTKLREQQDKMRKGQYAKIGALTKKCDELMMRMDIYDAFLCRENK